MPLSKYYKGEGEQVMKKMKKKYGSDKGKQVFYATANKHKNMIDTSPSNKNRKAK